MMSPETKNTTEQDSQQPPEQVPVFASWNVWYGLVLGVFALIVGLLSWFSRAFF
jgi:hypothetical protein